YLHLFSFMLPPAQSASLLPYTTLFRSGRAALNTTVIEAAQRHPTVRVHFNHKCTGVDLDSATAQLETSFVEAAVSAAHPKVIERSEEHTSELQSLRHLVCRLLLEKKNS